MGTYKIAVRERQYDSENSEIVDDELDMEWDDLSVAKANLRRMKAHTDLYEENRMETREQFLARVEAAKGEDWFTGSDYNFYIFDDSGGKHTQRAFWLGWGNQLIGAEIKEHRADWIIGEGVR